jgi:hypothetical protein
MFSNDGTFMWKGNTNMKRSLIMLAIATAVLLPTASFAQSSDAGMSSMEAQIRDRRYESVALTYVYGNSGHSGDSTQREMHYYSFILSGEAEVLDGWLVWASIPVNQQDGLLGSVTGVGDLMVVVDKKLVKLFGAQFSLGLGGRFATGNVNQSHLPQAYQSGIGTNNYLIQLDAISKALNFGVAYQISGGRNANELTQLKQGDLFVLSGGYTYRGDGFDIGLNLLAIKQLEQTSVLDPLSQTKSFIDVAGTDKVQLDVLLKTRVAITGWLSATATAGFPVNLRDVNVDGLTRAFTTSLGAAIEL